MKRKRSFSCPHCTARVLIHVMCMHAHFSHSPMQKALWLLCNNNLIYVYLYCVCNHFPCKYKNFICNSGQLNNKNLPFISREKGLALIHPFFLMMRKLNQAKHLVSKEMPRLTQWEMLQAAFSGLRPVFLPPGVILLNSKGPTC